MAFKRVHLFRLLVAVLSLAGIADAQVNTATILGRVMDPSGAVVVGAKVEALNELTGFSRTVESKEDGTYLIPLLPISAQYRVTAEAPGFKSFQRTGITLQLNQNARVDVQFDLGAVSEIVEITGDAPLVDTYSSAGGEVVEQKRIVDLPLNGRNPMQLASLVPGVTVASTRTTIDAGNRSGNFFNINGSRSNETDYQLDGVHFAGANNNSGLNLPNPDALQEFKLITNSYSAEYGIFSGGVFKAVTKSGTNEVHGSAWEFLRNDNLNARNFFSAGVPVLKQNQFGAGVGFPILKNRLFGFVSYQGLRIRGTQLRSSFPLTAAERTGVFSRAIKDPLTGELFPNNTIPGVRLNPVSGKIINDLLPVAPDAQGGQLITEGSRPIDVNSYVGKMDVQISSSDTLSVSFMHDKTTGSNPFAIGPYPSLGQNVEDQIIPLLAISETHVFSPTVLNEFRFGRATQEETRACSNTATPRDLGINIDLFGPPTPPGINVPGRFSWGPGISCSWREGGTNWQISDSLSWSKGRHQIKFGGEYYFRELHLVHDNQDSGSFLFDGSTTGFGPADFYLGELTRVDRRSGSDKRAETRTTSFYFQDDFKMHPRLTLNLGLRYEVLGPYGEVRGLERPEVGIPQIATIRVGERSSIIPTAHLGLLFVGDKTSDFPDGLPNSMTHIDYRQIQPRFGFAWDVFGDGRTSVRSSYGLYSNAAFGDMYQTGQNAPFLLAQTLNRPAGGFADPWMGLQNPFPYTLDLDNPANLQNLFPIPVQGFSVDPTYRSPRIQAITFNVQREVAKDLSLEVGYVGRLGRQLYLTRNLNTAVYVPGVDSQGTPFSTLANTDSRRRLIPTVFQKINNQESTGNSAYHSLQWMVRYRPTYGLTLMSAYTWSKSIDTGQTHGVQGVPYQDSENIQRDRGPSNWDLPHVWRLSWIYEIPTSRSASPFLRHILGGWEISGITSLSSGSPVNVLTGRDNSLTANGNDRPDVIGDHKLSNSRSRGEKVASWFNTAAFRSNAIGQFGNLGRNALRSPGLSQTDLGLFKNIPLSESMRIQFRAELFNAFNQVNFNNPVNVLTSSTFGRLTSARDPRLVQFGLKLNW